MHVASVPVLVLHGANRLEVTVCSRRWYWPSAYLDTITHAETIFSKENTVDIPDWNARNKRSKEMIITQSLKELQSIMSDYVGIVRNDVRLQRCHEAP